VPALVLGVILGLVAGPIVGAVVGVVVLVGVAVFLWRGSTALALRVIGGRRLEEDEEPRLTNLVDGLCATFGVPRPALYLVPDAVPNACTLGRTPTDAALVVTSGLLDRLGLIEMEGVVAHELAHIKRADTVVASVTVGLMAPWIALGASDRLVHRAVGTGREYRADQVAAITVRYPPGLRRPRRARSSRGAAGP
jgi:heat shock protein HtpX